MLSRTVTRNCTNNCNFIRRICRILDVFKAPSHVGSVSCQRLLDPEIPGVIKVRWLLVYYVVQSFRM
jgi:hypothetical protein